MPYKGFRFRLPKKDFDALERLPDLLRILPLSKDEISKEITKIDEEKKSRWARENSVRRATTRDYRTKGDEDACSGEYYWNID